MTDKELKRCSHLEKRIYMLEHINKKNIDETDELIRCKRELLLLRNPNEPLHQGALVLDVHSIFLKILTIPKSQLLTIVKNFERIQ